MTVPVGFDRATETAPVAPAAQHERKVLARRILLDALVLGGLADSLLRKGPGVGLLLWMVAFAATVIRLARRRGEALRREQIGWLAAALFFAGCFGLRDLSELLFYDFMAMAGALLLCGATLAPTSPMRSILGKRVRDIARALEVGVKRSAGAIVPAFRESELGLSRSLQQGRARGVLRALVLTVPVLLAFGVLFATADPLFVALLALPNIDVDVVLSHLVLTAVFTWLTGGWLRGSFGHSATVPPTRRATALSLGTLDVSMMLGGVVVLFALFVGVQIGWLFGGERLVRTTTGLGYAEYARRGFFELTLVSLLVLPVLLGTRALIRDGDTVTVRRHRLLALPLLLLVGGVIASALSRMALYVHYYGLSTDRVYAFVFMLWLAIVFVWFGLTILRGRTHDFAAGMTITGFLTLAALNLTNPDALVARVNVARAPIAPLLTDSGVPSRGAAAQSSHWRAPIDYSYLTSRLSGDAAIEVARALVAPAVTTFGTPAHEGEVRARCDAVRTLLTRWGPSADRQDWRQWNVGAWRARAAIETSERELRAVSCWDSGSERPFGDRDRRAPTAGEQWYRDPDSR